MAALQGDRRDDSALSAEMAYRGLSADAARVFRLLPLHPRPDVPTAVVAALADVTRSEARGALVSLDRAGLVQGLPGGEDRWRMRDLASAHARRLSEAHAAADGRERARDRLLRHYQTATEAADGMLRGLPPIPVPQDFTGRDGALAWLDAERATLLAATRMAADVGRDNVARSLPLLMAYYLDLRGRFDDLLVATTIGLEAARRLGHPAAEGEALNNLGGALIGLGRYGEALTRYRDAVAVFRRMGDRRAEAEASANLAISLTGLERYDEARTAYQDAIVIFRETGDRSREESTLESLTAIQGTV